MTADNEVVENLRIFTTDKQPGIYIVGKKNVVVRNCSIIHHAQTVWPFGNGIYFAGADNLTIQDVDVQLVGVKSGPLPDLHNYNINGLSSSGVRMSNIRATGGSSGIFLESCPGAHVSNFVATNVRAVPERPVPAGGALGRLCA